MAAPAYAHDYAAQPSRRHETQRDTRASVRVVRGSKHAQQTSPLSSLDLVSIAKIGLVALLCFVIIGFVRVSVASAAYSTASQAHQLRTDITEMRTESSSFEVQKSLVASPTNLRSFAAEELGMAAPASTETLTLAADVVATDAEGNLSLSSSIAAVASQG